MKRLRIIADAHVWGANEAFAALDGFKVDLRLVEHADITPERLKDADVLIARSSTRVDARLLGRTPVRFVATATIGDDHVDKSWLKRRGIVFANAAGSSTGSVLEYMWAVLLELHAMETIRLPGLRLGVIGAGRIGERLARTARQLGLKVMRCDPPRAQKEGPASFHGLDDLLEQTDIISLHTPLTRDGPCPTFHLIGRKQLCRFKGIGLINAARGACVDNHALEAWLEEDSRHFAVLDCWENEPTPRRSLIAHAGVKLATPHIAGHSVDGKAANTWFVYAALCQWLGVRPRWHPPLEQEPPVRIEAQCTADPWRNARLAVRHVYEVARDHRSMRSWATLGEEELAGAFTRYRRYYPPRRAWHAHPLYWPGVDDATRSIARAIGLRLLEPQHVPLR